MWCQQKLSEKTHPTSTCHFKSVQSKTFVGHFSVATMLASGEFFFFFLKSVISRLFHKEAMERRKYAYVTAKD